MRYKSIKDIYAMAENNIGAVVKMAGWIRTSRTQKEVSFIELFDGTVMDTVQIVYDSSLQNYEQISKLNVGSCICLTGEIVLAPEQSKQTFEIKAIDISVEGYCDASYPLQKKRHGVEFLRTMPHLRGRTNLFSCVFRVRSVLTYAIHRFLNEEGFVNITTPCITTSDCEGAGETFKITTLDFNDIPKNEDGKVDFTQDFFGKQTFMTVSGQLNVEPFCSAFRNVYTFGPCFRAENSNTSRHLAEFWQVEPEMAFADLNDLIEFIEKMCKYIIKYVYDNCMGELKLFDKFVEPGLIAKLENVINSDFARITHKEAIDILLKCGETFEMPVHPGCSIQTEYEKYLAEVVFKRPVFITDYPKEEKSFYMKLNDDNETVAATDLMFPGMGEIVGASEREARYDVLLQRIRELGLKEEEYEWYLETRKYGTCTHSGFGIGIERMMCYITGISNIRDVIPYPRAPKYAEY